MGVPDEPEPAATTTEPPAAPPATETPPATAPATTTTDDKDKTDKTAKGKKEPKAVKRPEFDPEKMAENITAAATKAATDAALRAKPSEAPSPTPVDPATLIDSLPEEFQEDADVYIEMQRLHPEKHGKLIADLAAYAKTEEDYIRKWKREHPDDEFDPEAKIHDDFYDEHKPKFSKREFKEAERSIIERRTEERIEKKYGPKLQELEQQRKTQSITPEIGEAAHTTMEQILTGINPEYAKYADPKELARLKDADPDAMDVVNAVFTGYSPLISETVLLYSGATRFNENNPVHMELFKESAALETKLSKLPREQRLDGQERLFATREEYSQLSDTERKNRWVLERDHMIHYLAGKAQAEAQNIYKLENEKFERRAKARGLKTDLSPDKTRTNGDPQSATTPEPTTQPTPTPPPPTPSPSVTSQPVVRNEPGGAGVQTATWRDNFGFGARGK